MDADGLSAESPIRSWLNHPRGAPLLAQLVEGAGWSLEALRPLSALPLKKLIPMSGGALTKQRIELLCRETNADES